jgi:predicted DNA-binding transcriptional regulator AlpA
MTTEFDILTEKLMTLTDIIKMLKKANVGVTRNTMYRWIRSGYFPRQTLVIGKRPRWSETSVKSWLNKCVEDAKNDILPMANG